MKDNIVTAINDLIEEHLNPSPLRAELNKNLEVTKT
jgi:hypothetical protein